MINNDIIFFYFYTSPFVFAGLFFITISIIRAIVNKEDYKGRLITGMILSAYIGYAISILLYFKG